MSLRIVMSLWFHCCLYKCNFCFMYFRIVMSLYCHCSLCSALCVSSYCSVSNFTAVNQSLHYISSHCNVSIFSLLSPNVSHYTYLFITTFLDSLLSLLWPFIVVTHCNTLFRWRLFQLQSWYFHLCLHHLITMYFGHYTLLSHVLPFLRLLSHSGR